MKNSCLEQSDELDKTMPVKGDIQNESSQIDGIEITSKLVWFVECSSCNSHSKYMQYPLNLSLFFTFESLNFHFRTDLQPI